MYIASGRTSPMSTALATALSITLRTGSAAAWGANCSMALASSACMPRTTSTTRRALEGATRTNRACALASIVSPYVLVVSRELVRPACEPSAPTRAAVVLLMPTEGAGRGELAQLVADHRLGDEDRDVFATVVHRDGVPDHVRHHHGPTRPGLDDVLRALLVLIVHLLGEVVVDERALLQTTRHLLLLPDQRFLPVRRRRTIWRSLDLLARRVRPSGWPFGFTGCRPPEVRPSPPPCGWSTGFITTPRTVGRWPFQRIRPALPQLMLVCSAFPTAPTVARQRTSTLRISPEGIRSCAQVPSLATSWTPTPADRPIFAPPPGRSSMPCTTVPTGMLRNGRLLPGVMSAPAPDSTESPCRNRAGASMYRFSPSA